MSGPPILDRIVISGLRKLTPPGEPDVLAEVLNLFLAEVPPRITRLRNAVDAGSIQDVQRAAHSLKGSAGNIGARQLHEVCRQLDEISRSGDLTTAPPLVDALGLEFGKVEAEIHRILGE